MEPSLRMKWTLNNATVASLRFRRRLQRSRFTYLFIYFNNDVKSWWTLIPASLFGPIIYSYCSMLSVRLKPNREPEITLSPASNWRAPWKNRICCRIIKLRKSVVKFSTTVSRELRRTLLLLCNASYLSVLISAFLRTTNILYRFF